MIDQPTIDRILDAAQIYDVVSDFVTLRKRGVNYVGLCPFHDDKTPSFYVSPAKGLCKCFACGKGGNAVHFIMEHEQMSYPEALKYLAKKYGIEIKERELSSEEKIAQSERASVEFMLTRHIGLSAEVGGQWLIVRSPDVGDGAELTLNGILRFQCSGGIRLYF